ncbi:MAG: transposase, partial [Candidatus Sumerlaeia bacterium]|nr:transposase [Candidatus Sumerlaeia bacterium]
MRAKDTRLLRFVSRAYYLARINLPLYSHPHSPHYYTLPKLFCCLLLKIYLNTTYRGIEDILSLSASLQRILQLRSVPDHSTICRMMGKISKQLLRWILRAVLEEEGVAEEIIAIDGTGFREERASVYYQGRRGRKYRRWTKAVYAVGTQSKLILAQAVGNGPGSDSAYWGGLKREARRYGSPEGVLFIGDAGCDGGQITPGDIVPPIRRGGSLREQERIQRQELVEQARLDGVYGQRWQCEMVNSVIKRMFGETIRSVLAERKALEVLL